jgi:hypothetical protein
VTGLVEPITEWDRWRNAMGLPTDWQTHPLWNPDVEA